MRAEIDSLSIRGQLIKRYEMVHFMESRTPAVPVFAETGLTGYILDSKLIPLRYAVFKLVEVRSEEEFESSLLLWRTAHSCFWACTRVDVVSTRLYEVAWTRNGWCRALYFGDLSC